MMIILEELLEHTGAILNIIDDHPNEQFAVAEELAHQLQLELEQLTDE